MGQSNTEPTITIRAVDRVDTVRYEVEDNGLGISPQDQEALFEMLSRFHKDEAGGTGLGLSIVQRIVDKLGGTVGVDSEPGEGSTFWFTLPALSEEAAASNHS
jgi:signal transduction histidine kinase